ncbi:polysaccharide deacetylase family protein [Paenibacillus sp. UMB4589-SE434]|uniref:polysaccharide deacetylase family protein n=1 Tax=Paenibacillus sp. UMB4589-SE434 TaxID=3046314 RepID=UPI00254E5DF2|nr:polysaccharide deacetylase family protein [Paenibacillus sp. UMB4589-SE434]MDK8181015.1 polysaccharide deacetylase family protein [Paenibacillus sp. UMB4589-SE434]
MLRMNERLGFDHNQRLLIVNADDFGMCRSVNEAIKQLLQEEVISSATIMMPCAWSEDAARWSAANRQFDVGVHLTLTSEWDGYKWGPVCQRRDTSSLTTERGYFPASCLVVEQKAEVEQIRHEFIAQIEAALHQGIDVSHLDNHMGSVYGLETGRDFLQLVFDLCSAYDLPFRLPKAGMNVPPELTALAKQRAEQAGEQGIMILDDLLGLRYALETGETYEVAKASMCALLRGLQPGLSEIIIHPAHVSDELKSITPHWQKRGFEFDLFRDPDIRELLREENIQLVRWLDVRQVQRNRLKE